MSASSQHVSATSSPRSYGTEYDPFSSNTVANPYPIYRHLLASDPVYYNARLGFYALTRYADIVEYGRDWNTFSYTQGADIDDTGDAYGPGNFLEQDPPVHTAMRNVVRRVFAPNALRDRLEAFIEQQAGELVGAIVRAGAGDYGRDVAWGLPMRVIADLLGIPRSDLPMLASWEAQFSHRILGQAKVPPASIEASNRFRAYFAKLIAERTRDPRDDVLSLIAAADFDGQPLGESGAGMAFLLWAASVETTACLLTNGVVLLDQYPEQREWLATNPAALPAAIEEMLRFETPLQVMRRTTTRPVDVHGVEIPEGSSVLTVYAAANRDERKFSEPDRFDITRKADRHLAFGDGIHHCLGAPLARLEARIVLRTILDQCPRYSVTTDGLERLSSYIDRGFTCVPIVTR